jgi:hypothetical protein
MGDSVDLLLSHIESWGGRRVLPLVIGIVTFQWHTWSYITPDRWPIYRFLRRGNRIGFLQQMASRPPSLLPPPLETASNPDLVEAVPVSDISVPEWHPKFPRPQSSIRSSRTLPKTMSHIRTSSSSVQCLHLSHWRGINQIQPNTKQRSSRASGCQVT